MGDQASLVHLADGEETRNIPKMPGQFRLLKLSSRMGAFGFLVAAYSLLGMPLPPQSRGLITGSSLLVGGMGAFAASALVSIRLRGPFRILELAAVLGLALGAAALFLGGFLLSGGWAGLERLVVLTYLAIPVLGLALVLLFVAGFFKRLFTSKGTKPEFT